MKKQILAMGGGGFSMEPDNLKLDRYLLSLSNKEKPKVCFVSTASGDAESYIERFYNSMAELNCKPSHLALYKGPSGSLEDFVFDKDIIYVGGGNTRNLMALWREWELDNILFKAYESGIIMAGISAGSICWFEEGVTDSIPGVLSKMDCLGFLKGSNCPHYDSEVERRPSYHKLIMQGMLPGIACDDGVAAHYIEGELHSIVSSRPNVHAYSVKKQAEVVEEKIQPTYL